MFDGMQSRVDLIFSVRPNLFLLTLAVGSTSISCFTIFNSDGLHKVRVWMFIDKLLFRLPSDFNLGSSLDFKS